MRRALLTMAALAVLLGAVHASSMAAVQLPPRKQLGARNGDKKGKKLPRAADSSITYNVPAAMAWLSAQGCSNASQNPICPGGAVCYDQEFTARMLAAGGVIALDPNAPSNAAYQSYSYDGDIYDLTTQQGPPAGLYDFLLAIGWYNPQLPGCDPSNEAACYPAGAVISTMNIWRQPVLAIATGEGLCMCGSPLNTNAPHCGMSCPFFGGNELFYPPPAKVAGPIFGSYTPNNQTYQDFTLWPNMFNSPTNAINQALTVLEVPWTADDAATVLNQLNFVWMYETAVPVITWTPYPYATWTNPSPNVDIVNGKYDAYIDQFLSMLSSWLAGGHIAYLRFAPQPNGNWFPWSPSCPSCGSTGQHINQTVASYVAMYKYVIGKVRSSSYSLGPDVLQLIFDVNNADAAGSGSAEAFYPGSDYADWICVTGMNWGTTMPGNQWSSPSQVFSPMVQRMQALSSTTPLAISGATTSVPEGTTAKNAWIDAFFQYAVSANVKMLLYHNADSSTDLAVFGGSKGLSTWTSPLSQVQYNVYSAWSTGLNNLAYGLQGGNTSNPLVLSPTQFSGKF